MNKDNKRMLRGYSMNLLKEDKKKRNNESKQAFEISAAIRRICKETGVPVKMCNYGLKSILGEAAKNRRLDINHIRGILSRYDMTMENYEKIINATKDVLRPDKPKISRKLPGVIGESFYSFDDEDGGNNLGRKLHKMNDAIKYRRRRMLSPISSIQQSIMGCLAHDVYNVYINPKLDMHTFFRELYKKVGYSADEIEEKILFITSREGGSEPYEYKNSFPAFDDAVERIITIARNSVSINESYMRSRRLPGPGGYSRSKWDDDIEDDIGNDIFVALSAINDAFGTSISSSNVDVFFDRLTNELNVDINEIRNIISRTGISKKAYDEVISAARSVF